MPVKASLLASVALLAVGVAAGSAGNSTRASSSLPTWVAPVNLSGIPPYGIADPDVAVNASGDTIAAWSYWNGSQSRVRARFRPAGGRWLPAVESAGWLPSVAIDDAGTALVAWTREVDRGDGTYHSIAEARFRKPQSGWSDVEQLSTSDDGWVNLDSVHVGADAGGNALAVWLSRRGLRSAYRPATAARWLQPEDVARGYGPDFVLDVSSSGKALLAWAGANDRERWGVHTVLGSEGQWQAATTIAFSRTTVNTPGGVSASVDAAGDAVVAWTDVEHGNAIISAAYHSAEVSGWEIQQDLSFPDGQAARPAVGLDGRGNALATWDAWGLDIQGSFRPAAGAWQRPVVVSDGPGFGPKLAVNAAGGAVVAWTSPTVGAPIRAAVRSADDATWRPAGEVIPSSGRLGDISIDGAGNALAAWTGGESERGAWVAALDAAGPVLSELQMPERGYVGQRLSFSVQAGDVWSALAGPPVWSFGNGVTPSGRTVTHTYSAPGRYDVSVTARDTLQHESGATRPIRIERANSVRNLRAPVIIGTRRVGATLTCRPGNWAGTRPIRYTFRWLRDGRVMPDATGPRLRLRAGDAGALIACRVEATNYAGPGVATSKPVRVRSG